MKMIDNQMQLDEDRVADLITELLNIYDIGLFDGEQDKINSYKHMSQLRYEHLIALFSMRNVIEGCDKLFDICYKSYISYGKTLIRGKISNGEKINVAFLPISAAEWPAEDIYNKLSSDGRFNVKVIPVPLAGRNYYDRRKIYIQTYNYFKNRGYIVEKVYNPGVDEICDWKDIGGFPDVVINVTPWYLDMADYYQITKLPSSVINMYISYGLSVGQSPDGGYDKVGLYNNDFINMQWRVYTESVYDYNSFCKYEMLKGSNIRNSGYAKMDYFYKKHNYTDSDIGNMWKIPQNSNIKEYKRIIIAPHFSVGNTNEVNFSTFSSNMYFLLYLAEKYKDSISFIFKPHPNLRNAVVQNGYMNSYEDYEDYLNRWRELPNGNVVEEDDYRTIFETSDGMIMDSMSFVGEYLYVQKPLLFLTRDEQSFNDLGKALMPAHYMVDGRNYTEIEDFIVNVILAGNDKKKSIREEVFYRELDYYGKNGELAADYIYNEICSELL